MLESRLILKWSHKRGYMVYHNLYAYQDMFHCAFHNIRFTLVKQHILYPMDTT